MTYIKSITVLCLLASLPFFLSSCYTAKVSAPPDSDVQLASSSESLPVVKTTKNWYLLFGLVPLSNTATDQVEGLDKVRVETKWTFLDGIINGVAGLLTLRVCTTEIHGAQTSGADKGTEIEKASASTEGSSKGETEE
jgi:hypothetical protein